MKRELSVAALALAISAAAGAQQSDERQMAQRLDAAIDRAVAEQRIVGTVVLVMKDGKLVYHRAAGLSDKEAGKPMAEDSIFLLSSVTKAIVTFAALRLVDQGVLNLDDPVTKWLPDFRPKLASGESPTITVRELLTHTAGLSYDFREPAGGPYERAKVSNGFDAPDVSLAENLQRINTVPLSYPPGTSWGYSVAHDVLGAVIEKATGKPLPEVVRSLVTAPLEMKDTAFSVADRSRLVSHYANATPSPVRITDGQVVPLGGNPVRFVPSRIFSPAAFPSGGAGMAGTAADVVKLLGAIDAGGAGLVKQATLASSMQPLVGGQAKTQGPGWGFGYGWAVLVDPAATGTPFSKGTIKWGGVYGHGWFIDPVKHLCVVALTNTTFEGMAGKFPVEIRDAVYAAGKSGG